MTTATPLFRWRRVVVLCAASVLLHYLAIGWGSAHLAAPLLPDRPPGPAFVAELRSLPLPAPEAGAPAALPQVQLSGPPEKPRRPDPARQRYQVKLPPSAQLTFDVERVEANGSARAGQAVMDWRHGAGQYRLTMLSEVADSGPVELASEGAIGAGGIVPRKMSARRGSKAGTATHFNAQQGRITFSASEGSVPMTPGTQDKVSLPMQLAGIARAGRRQLGAGLEVLVGEEKDASVFRFAEVGQEEIDTRMGRLATWRLSQSTLPGTYRARLEVWLAPGHAWFPVRLRSTEANGTVTTRTISKIVLHDGT